MGTSGFGRRFVRGRKRVPKPAAKIMLAVRAAFTMPLAAAAR